MNWFAKNGDKLFTLITLALGLVTANNVALGLGAHMVLLAWLTVGSSFVAAAHTLYFPNTQVVAPSVNSPAINTGSGKQGGFVMLRFLLLVSVLCAGLLPLSGCATLEKLAGSPEAPAVFVVTADAAVGVAVGKGINPQVIANIASELKQFDSGTTVTIPALNAELGSLEARANFNVAEQAAAGQLVLAFSTIIAAQTQNGTVDASTQATIQAVLTDVIQAAELFGATAPVAVTSPVTIPAATAPPTTDDMTTPGPLPVAAPKKSAIMSTLESPAAVGAAASTVLLAGLQAFAHVSFDGRTAAGLTVLFTLGAAYLEL